MQYWFKFVLFNDIGQLVPCMTILFYFIVKSRGREAISVYISAVVWFHKLIGMTVSHDELKLYFFTATQAAQSA